MNRLKQLADELDVAQVELKRVQGLREEFVRAEKEKIRQQADHHFGEQFRLAKEAEEKAQRNYDEERIRIISTSKLVGCMVEKKKYGGYGMHMRERGVLEVMTHTTEVPNNLRYSRPSIGTVFVRILKADGSPSKRVDAYNTNHWTLVKVPE